MDGYSFCRHHYGHFRHGVQFGTSQYHIFGISGSLGRKPAVAGYFTYFFHSSDHIRRDSPDSQSFRGLRYGKPPKTTAAYTYVDRPPRRRRADRFIWVAAIAAAIAVAAIAFGYLREANDKEAEMQYLEQPADPQPATDTGAATPEQPITE